MIKASEARHLSNMMQKDRDDERESILAKKFDNISELIKGSLYKNYIQVEICRTDVNEFEWLMRRLGYTVNYVNSATTKTTSTIDVRW